MMKFRLITQTLLIAGLIASLNSCKLLAKKPLTREVKALGSIFERSTKPVKLTLDNGLTVVIQENHAAPVVALNVWVSVGSGDEMDTEAGIAHIHEHMLFKGTEKRGVGDIALEVESAGGEINAFTSNDVTVYHIVIASRFMDMGLDILSDAVLHPTFDSGELNKELKVILEELNRMQDDPRRMIYLDLMGEAYTAHPYRRPVIGYEKVIQDMTREQVMTFWKHWYVPRNMSLVIVGDVKAEEVLPVVKKYFSDGKAASAPGRAARKAVEPEQKSMQEKVTGSDINESYLELGFHIPDLENQDTAALDLIGMILGNGESSRLVYRVRSELKLVNKVWAYSFTPKDPGLLMVGADLTPGKARPALEELLKQVFLLKHEPVQEWELVKAKTQIESDSIYSRETVEGQARKLGFFLCLTGNPDYEDKYLEQVRSVTSAEIQKVARKYLTLPNLSLAFRVPQKNQGKNPSITDDEIKEIAARVKDWDDNFDPEAVTKVKPVTPPVLPPAGETGEHSKVAVREPVRYELGNGIRLIVKENHAVALVSVRAAMQAGLQYETPENSGISNFIAETVTEGTKDLSAQEIHSRIEAMAGQIDGFSGRNSFGVNLNVISKYFHPALEILAAVLREPSFPEEQVDKARMVILSTIRSERDQPMRVAMNNYRSALYQQHPFGMNMLGTEGTVRAMTQQQLASYYKRFAVPSNLVITVVGDVKAEEVQKKIESLLGDWHEAPVRFPEVPAEARPSAVRNANECMARNQTNVVVGFQGTTVLGADRYPISVLDAVLSGMGGRLFIDLREKQSLAYQVTAFHVEGLAPGFLGLYIGCAPEKAETALNGIFNEIDRISAEPVSATELDRAKRYLIGEFEIDLQKNSEQAANITFDELYGLGFRNSEHYAENIESVTAESVQAAAQKYFQSDAYVLSIVEPCRDVEEPGEPEEQGSDSEE